MNIKNIGSIGPEGLEVHLDNILCLVGENNSGKSTVLRAYELAVSNQELKPDDVCFWANGVEPSVEIWVHIPEGTGNIDEKWKEKNGNLLLVRSKWTWPLKGGKPARTTWDPKENEYSSDAKASGLDNVFSSRLPKPIRIGSLENPDGEHKDLLTLIIGPIADAIKADIAEDLSKISSTKKAFIDEVNRPVQKWNELIESTKNDIHKSYNKIFPKVELDIKIKLDDFVFDPAKSLLNGSSLKIVEGVNATTLSQQGTGSQRALFWSMLDVRHSLSAHLGKEKKGASKTKKTLTDEGETEEVGLPSYMLLIDEPENALHPYAIKAARDFLYELSKDPKWQVIISTHSPYFINPLENHTTIVRLERKAHSTTPKTYQTDSISFSQDERDNLKMLLQMDYTISEMFFGSYPIIVEGDTEFAVFNFLLNEEGFSNQKCCILRARGKETIPTLIKMLTHFDIGYSVLHDLDTQKREDGGKNSAWSANMRIKKEIEETRKKGHVVIHRISCVNFERHYFSKESSKDKPWKALQNLRQNEAAKKSISTTLLDLISPDLASHCLCNTDDFEAWLVGLENSYSKKPEEVAV